jgi:hypothetical protein
MQNGADRAAELLVAVMAQSFQTVCLTFATRGEVDNPMELAEGRR